MKVTIFSRIVILANILFISQCIENFIFYVDWVPTICHGRSCVGTVRNKFIISRWRDPNHVPWIDGGCNLDDNHISEELENIEYTVPGLRRYWPDKNNDEFFHHNVYMHCGSCQQINGERLSPTRYFEIGIEYYKSIKDRLKLLESYLSTSQNTLAFSTLETHLRNVFPTEVKVVCAENENSVKYIHQLVICFGQNSTLTDCNEQYTTDSENVFDNFNLRQYPEDSTAIRQPSMCTGSITIPHASTNG
ncbi:ribonuclease T2-like isoform 1 [Schistosoma japonicum]|uniref:Ribonuclease T2-like isoform 1 n=1 Tax=Schistosoma japonicum TaxID=6182 RepID=A0A4Z2DJ87_SCHJA|nr:ribonuclease T2-like isoform 1 [Schistosoma japonicum]